MNNDDTSALNLLDIDAYITNDFLLYDSSLILTGHGLTP